LYDLLDIAAERQCVAVGSAHPVAGNVSRRHRRGG
jgi:hypothetical protein